MNPDVIAMDIGRRRFRFGWFEGIDETLFERQKESFRIPTVLQKQEFQSRAFTALPQGFRFAP